MIALSVTLTSRGSGRTSEYQRFRMCSWCPNAAAGGLQLRCPAQPKTRCAAPAGIGSAFHYRQGNDPARRLYDSLGYRATGCAPVRVQGTITLRGRAVEVNDTLDYLEKLL